VILFFALGIGLGLAAVAGLRAFLPLAIAGLAVQLGLLLSPEPSDLLAGVGWPVVGALAGLAVAEIVLDKAKAVERVFNTIMVPVRAAAGGLAFAMAPGVGLNGEALPLLAIGVVVAGIVAVLKVVLRPPAKVASTGVSVSFLSLIEDATAFVGGLVAVFVPFLSLLLVAFLLFFYHRLRRRRGRTYSGLRILRD